MGHPGLLRAQPDGRAMLLCGEGCQWYYPGVSTEEKTFGKGEPPATLAIRAPAGTIRDVYTNGDQGR